MVADEPSGPMDLLLEHLRQKASAGQTHVWLSPAARDLMRAWHQARRGGPRVPRESSEDARSARPVAAVSATAVRAAGSADVPVPPAAAVWPEGAPEAGLTEALAAVRAGVLACPVYAALRARGALRDTMVFATGHPASPLVLVGEAPGAEEEKLGEPFVGPAGNLLTKMIVAMGLDRSKVYITNIVKYRPVIEEGDQGSRNRRPTAEEIAAGLPHLRKELAALRPRALVALGATALEGLAGEALPIGQARGRWRTFDGIPLMPTFHPSYLLHNESLTERRKVWEDLLQVMEKLGLPISAKQRAFFRT